MTLSNYRTSLIFLILTIVYSISFLVTYADSGTKLNSTVDSSQVQNVTIQKTLGTANFSNIKCSQGPDHILLEGQFHNGDVAYKVIFLRMLIFDQTGNLITTGNGYIADIKPHEIKNFNAITRFNGDFSLCDIQIDNAIPK